MRRRDVNDLSLFIDDTDGACTQFARAFNKSLHHDTVRFLQIFQRKRIKFGQYFIDGKGIFNGKDVVPRSHNALSVQNVRHLF